MVQNDPSETTASSVPTAVDVKSVKKFQHIPAQVVIRTVSTDPEKKREKKCYKITGGLFLLPVGPHT